MSDLMSKMMKAGSVKDSFILEDSPYFNKKDVITTNLPILNVAFSGELDGGMVPGLTIFAGASKSFKSLLAIYCMRAYFKKYPDAICLFYDTEFGTPPAYLKAMGVDASRILHIPVEHVEQLKFDMVKRLSAIERGDHVFIMVDSLGNLASKKEVEDAEDEKSVADMSRAKSIRSFLRIISTHLTTKDLPCIIINHIYNTMEMYSKVVIPGGTAVTYIANQIFVITKAQEKNAEGAIEGYTFTINIEKSRFVREKSKLSFTVKYNSGIGRWSGMLDLALEGQFVAKPKQGWYAKVDPETGELMEPNLREKDLMLDNDFWNNLIVNDKFKQFVKDKFVMAGTDIVQEEVDSIED